MEPYRSSTDAFDLIDIPIETNERPLAQIVYEGLSQNPKRLPSYLFYDQAGSELFEQITKLPEYYPTRTELEILENDAEEIVCEAGRGFELVEFGSGSSYKTRILIDAALRLQGSLTYIPIDISRDFLIESVQNLLEDYASLHIVAVAAEYRAGLQNLPKTKHHRLILFMGSNIGNMEDEEAIAFLSSISDRMSPSDRLMLGADLAKDPSIVIPAYNDAQGVTAQFNINMLDSLNAQIGTNFQTEAFQHRAPYLQDQGHVQMQLVATQAQIVECPDFPQPIQINEGEIIVTEISSKYTPERLEELFSAANLQTVRTWNDDRNWFSVVMLQKRHP